MCRLWGWRPNWDPPPPYLQTCASPPLGPGGTYTLAGDGVEGSQFGRGDRHCGTLGIYVLCDLHWNQPMERWPFSRYEMENNIVLWAELLFPSAANLYNKEKIFTCIIFFFSLPMEIHASFQRPNPKKNMVSTWTLGQSRLYPQGRDFEFSLSSTAWKWVTKYWK